MNTLRPSTNSLKSIALLLSTSNAEYSCSKKASSFEDTDGTYFFTVYSKQKTLRYMRLFQARQIHTSLNTCCVMLALFEWIVASTLCRRSWISFFVTAHGCLLSGGSIGFKATYNASSLIVCCSLDVPCFLLDPFQMLSVDWKKKEKR